MEEVTVRFVNQIKILKLQVEELIVKSRSKLIHSHPIPLYN